MITELIKFFKDEEGTGIGLWALILALIIILAIVGITAVGESLKNLWAVVMGIFFILVGYRIKGIAGAVIGILIVVFLFLFFKGLLPIHLLPI